MKVKMSSLLLTIFFALSCATQVQSASEPTTVKYVDIERYMGKWYEIARFPQSFQRKCGATTAEYTLKDNGTVRVVNTCKRLDRDGALKDAKATAFVVDKDTNAKLKVSFVPILQYFGFFAGDYWILDLGADYDYALVGGPDRNSLWILSRTPVLDQDIYDHLVEVAEDKGFDISKLVRSPTWK